MRWQSGPRNPAVPGSPAAGLSGCERSNARNASVDPGHRAPSHGLSGARPALLSSGPERAPGCARATRTFPRYGPTASRCHRRRGLCGPGRCRVGGAAALAPGPSGPRCPVSLCRRRRRRALLLLPAQEVVAGAPTDCSVSSVAPSLHYWPAQRCAAHPPGSPQPGAQQRAAARGHPHTTPSRGRLPGDDDAVTASTDC